MHVMGPRQCLFLERMSLETPIVTAMVHNVYVFAKQAQRMMELATCRTTQAIICTNTQRPVSVNMTRASSTTHNERFQCIIGYII